jgi:outer membrane protein assembly factor BamE (lipoprotein component of BamABCDE complex)
MKYLLNISIAAIATILIAGCLKHENHLGYSFEQTELDKIEEGKTRKQDVLDLLGSPTSTSDFGADTYYYISIDQERAAFFNPKVEQQKIVEITFGSSEIVQQVKVYDSKDSQKVAYYNKSIDLKGNKIGPRSDIGEHR